VYPEYLLVQRKDSIAFVEFVRGKYDPADLSYIRDELISEMTADEQQRLKTQPLLTLWSQVWGSRASACPSAAQRNEIASSTRAYDTLCASLPSGGIASLVTSVTKHAAERAWGFPKGRKSGTETDVACAVREFQEECNVDPRHIHVYDNPSYEEVFEGCNGVLYRHVYFLARIVDMRASPAAHPTPGSVQAQEVGAVDWYSYSGMCTKFTDHQSRLAVAERANADVIKIITPTGGPSQFMNVLCDPKCDSD
jgi:8-oxo-dGTP pyrophosphatase MutT (NUDIX family)